jgi:hypothetical protein
MICWCACVGGAFGRPDPAGAEDQAGLPFALACVDHRAWPSVRRRPHDVAIEPHLVGMDSSRLQVLDQQERVVVALHVERACPMSEHLHLGRSGGLYPNGRRCRAHVAEERAEDDVGFGRAFSHASGGRVVIGGGRAGFSAQTDLSPEIARRSQPPNAL